MTTILFRSLRPALCCFFILATAMAFSQSVNLKLNLTEGERYPYVYDFKIGQELSGGPMKMVMLFQISMLVKSESDTSKIIDCTFERYKMSMQNAQFNLDADTDVPVSLEDAASDPGKVVAKIFQAFKGQHFFMRINSRGDLVKLMGFDKIRDNIVDSAAVWFQLNEDAKAQMSQNMGKQFSDQSMQDMMAQSFNIFPGKSVKVGDTWTKEVASKVGVGVKMNTVYTVKEIGKETVTLNAQSKLSTTDAAGGTMSGDQQAVVIIDKKTGMILESTLDQKLAGETNGSPSTLTSHGRIYRTDKVK